MGNFLNNLTYNDIITDIQSQVAREKRAMEIGEGTDVLAGGIRDLEPEGDPLVADPAAAKVTSPEPDKTDKRNLSTANQDNDSADRVNKTSRQGDYLVNQILGKVTQAEEDCVEVPAEEEVKDVYLTDEEQEEMAEESDTEKVAYLRKKQAAFTTAKNLLNVGNKTFDHLVKARLANVLKQAQAAGAVVMNQADFGNTVDYAFGQKLYELEKTAGLVLVNRNDIGIMKTAYDREVIKQAAMNETENILQGLSKRDIGTTINRNTERPFK